MINEKVRERKIHERTEREQKDAFWESRDEQQRQREEVGEEIIEMVIQTICEMHPEMLDVEPLIRDEQINRVAENILERLAELRQEPAPPTLTDQSGMTMAWKSLLFSRNMTEGEVELIRRVIAIINRKGDILRIDTIIIDPKSIK